MKRILHIVGTMNRAGAETMIMNLYRIIDKAELQFDFLYFTSKKCDYDEQIEALGGQIYRVNESNPIRRMYATKKLLQENPQWQIIHGHTLFSNAFHVWAAKKAKIPFRIVHAHSTNDTSHKSFIGKLYKKISIKGIDKNATHFISCGMEAWKFLFPKQKEVLLLPNSIDTTYFAEIGENEKDYLDKEFHIDDSYLKIIQVGRLQTVKNHVFSLRIAEKLKEYNIPFKMFFVGQGALEEDLKQKIKEKKLKNEVLLIGLRSDIPQLMAGADVMLMPSLYEGFGVVLIEAQAAGIPSLISNTIPIDADVGIGLIYVNSLEEKAEVWANHIVEIYNRNTSVDKEKRLLQLKEYGYDHHTSVKILSELYKSMN